AWVEVCRADFCRVRGASEDIRRLQFIRHYPEMNKDLSGGCKFHCATVRLLGLLRIKISGKRPRSKCQTDLFQVGLAALGEGIAPVTRNRGDQDAGADNE